MSPTWFGQEFSIVTRKKVKISNDSGTRVKHKLPIFPIVEQTLWREKQFIPFFSDSFSEKNVCCRSMDNMNFFFPCCPQNLFSLNEPVFEFRVLLENYILFVTLILNANKKEFNLKNNLYLKNGNPSNKYIVKANSSPSWIIALLFALRVILIPVHTFIWIIG